jgi:hypothetical protein
MRQTCNGLLEALAALFKSREHIETGAGWG